MKRRNPLQRAMDRFAADPASMRNAVYVMIVITVAIVLVGGVIVWVFDRRDFPDLGSALWYTLQTVTTVGYGDNVPTTGVGRIVGASVMVVAVSLIAILTASITSVFVEAAQRRQRAARGPGARLGRVAAQAARRGPRQAGSPRGHAQRTRSRPRRRAGPLRASSIAPPRYRALPSGRTEFVTLGLHDE